MKIPAETASPLPTTIPALLLLVPDGVGDAVAFVLLLDPIGLVPVPVVPAPVLPLVVVTVMLVEEEADPAVVTMLSVVASKTVVVMGLGLETM